VIFIWQVADKLIRTCHLASVDNLFQTGMGMTETEIAEDRSTPEVGFLGDERHLLAQTL
jgi:hypothetical protein